MYATLWRWLPGPTWVKVIEVAVVVVLVLVVLMGWVFPAIERALDLDSPAG